METSKLMERIAERGGLMAACAKMYVNDEQKTNQFLKECYEQFHTSLAENYWGKELINEITKHCQRNENYRIT